MLRLASLGIAKRLGILIASAIVGLVLLLVFFMVSERVLLMKERQSAVRQTVEIAHGLLVHFHDQATKGKMPEDEAKQRALDAIKGLRYSGAEYFWINDMHPKMVMHPIRPELEGKDLTENKDPNGKHLFVEFVKTVKASGAGNVDYMWPKPGSDKPVMKVSYVKGFAPWGWVIGSGVYVDTVDATIIERAIQSGAGALVLAVILLAVGLMITRSIVKQLGGEPAEVNSITHRMAQGDLSVDVKLRAGDQSSIMHGIKTMRDNVAQIVAHVRQGSESVATASAEIAQGNQDLSSRTESQASALEETAASMEELGSTVKQNADNAKQANQLAQSASTVAVQGGEVVAQVVDTMKGINESSRKINDIISVIDGIAFQTNILAGRQHHERGGDQHPPRDRHHGGDQCRQFGAECRRGPGQRGRDQHGPGHAAERRVGGRNGRRRREPACAGAGPGADGGGVQAQRPGHRCVLYPCGSVVHRPRGQPTRSGRIRQVAGPGFG